MAWSASPIVSGSDGLGANGGTSSAVNTTGGDFLAVSVGFDGAGTGLTLTDSKSNTWNLVAEYTANGRHGVRIYYAIAPTVGSGHTFSFGSANSFCSIAYAAWSGGHATAPEDNHNGGGASGVTSQSSGSITPSENDCLVVSALMHGDPSTIGIGGGSLAILNTTDAQSFVRVGVSLACEVQTTATARTATWSSTASVLLAAEIVSFKAAAGGGGGGVVIPVFMAQYRQRVR